ncbi:MAG: ECF transporter S component [Oscillospiraceae bacterium]|nr:ECF transporter S component [Oscillospiraceae bacterium]
MVATLSPAKKLVLTAACIALCVVVPMAFHAIPNAGTVFLPMHLPVLLCGMLCGWPFGGMCGLLGPLLSSLTTGMPPAAMLPAMMLECAVYGAAAGFLMKRVRTGRLYPDLYISLIPAMLLGRIVSGIAKALIFAPGTTLVGWATVSFVTGLPGIVIQLILIPAILFALTKAKLIPARY